MKFLFAFLFAYFFIFNGCNPSDLPEGDKSTNIINTEQLLDDVKYLSSDELAGRKTGTEGNRLAREFITERFRALGLEPAGEQDFEQIFSHTNPRNSETFEHAVNVAGIVPGADNPETYIVITAHYDHLGEQNGEIYNGADDNASGTAALLNIAEYFTEHPPSNSLLFIAFDAEEQGLAGARYFINAPTVPAEDMLMNVNMDMISTNFENELYAVGTAHYPYLKPYVETANQKTSIDVLFGYDTDEWAQNWTTASDHGPFHLEGIPFIYFGVEDHPHYHQPSDIFDNINPEFYIQAVETIIHAIGEFDLHSGTIQQEATR